MSCTDNLAPEEKVTDVELRWVCSLSSGIYEHSVHVVGKRALVEYYSNFYDFITGKEVFKLPQQVSAWIDVDDSVLAEGSDKQTFYDMKTGKEAFKLPQKAECIHWAGYISGEDRQTYYSTKNGKVINVLPNKTAYSPAVTPFEEKALVLGEDQKTFYDLRTGAVVFRLPTKVKDEVYVVGEQVLVEGWENGKIFFDARTGKEAFTLPQDVSLFGYACNVREKTLIQGKDGKTFFDLRTGREAFCLEQKVDEGCFFVEEQRLVFGKDRMTFFDLGTGKRAYRLPQRAGGRVSKVGNQSLFRGWDCKTFYDLRTGDIALKLEIEVSDNMIVLGKRLYTMDKCDTSFRYSNSPGVYEIRLRRKELFPYLSCAAP